MGRARGAAVIAAALALGVCREEPAQGRPAVASRGGKPVAKVVKSDEEWKRILTREQYEVLRKKGTERAFTGACWNNHEPGTYACAGCGTVLFSAKKKFDSGTGWPSYTEPVDPGLIVLSEDRSHGTVRTEVLCAVCDGHLGHVFEDGPGPTGLRYCINSAALNFRKSE